MRLVFHLCMFGVRGLVIGTNRRCMRRFASVLNEKSETKHFISEIVERDLAAKKIDQVITRFPPEPNGYLHIGHAKSICLNFGLADEYDGKTYLRFDDTNPEKEDEEYVQAIIEDVQWLLSVSEPWEEIRYASDYFDEMKNMAVWLIEQGKAYVDSQSVEEMRIQRGTLTQKGTDSPYRNRTIAENLNLFEKMQSELNDGDAVLRAKLDMSSPNLNLRDPALYRIKNLHHQRTGSTWSIYPMYDYAHAISDAIEGITHSLCTLEFENHRPLYDWVVDQYIKYATITNKPKQIEFSRLNLQHTITSKRKLASLVNAQYVQGWDDPRMPTIRGLRTRGIPPAAIRLFCQRIGISKVDTRLEPSILDDCVRAILDDVPDLPRAFAVIEPLEIIFSEEIHQQIHVSQDRILEFCSGINEKYYIERADFWDTQTQGEIPKDWKRFSDDQGSLVRLRYAYVIECLKVDRDPETNEPIRIHCQIDPETFAGKPTTKRSKKKQPGIIHWLRETDAVQIPLIHYDRLFLNPDPTELDEPNPNSMIRYNQALVEKRAVDILNNGEPFQFERQGYYVFNNIEFRRIVSLRDNFSTKLSITPKYNPNMEQAPTGKKNHDAPKRRSGGKNKYVDPDRNYRSGNFDFGHGPGTQTYLEPEVIEASRIDLRAGLILQNWTVNIGGDQSISIKTKSLPAPPIGTNVVVFMNAPNGPQILYTQHCQKDILIQPPPETEPGTRLLIHGCSADSPPSELSDVSSLISNLVLRSGRLYFRFRPLGTEDGNRPCVLPSILNDDQTL